MPPMLGDRGFEENLVKCAARLTVSAGERITGGGPGSGTYDGDE